ncbi:MAG TPA: hypothetical protein VFM18_09860, partial [Methanosarcina sp.]|nr:hypothetical protein [Methanosarcina sp.]
MVSIKVNISAPLRKMLEKDVLKSNRVRFTFREQLEKIVELARKTHIYITRTGKLDQSVEQKLISDAPLRGLIQLNDENCTYGKFIHNGAPRHWVQPTDKKALRFVSGGQFIFSKGHFVNGIKPDPFLENAVKNQLPEFEKELNDAVYKEMDS